MLYPFIYKVTACYESNGYVEEKEQGILFAHSYSEAASLIDTTYAETLVDMYIYELEGENLLPLPAETVEEIIKF